MLEAPDWHGWLVPKIQDRPRLNKPPLIYWLQAGSASIFTKRWEVDGKTASARDAIWMYRVPSLVAAVVIVFVVWRWGCAMYDSRVATLAAAILAVCPVMAWESKQARADMVMVAATTFSLWALWKLWNTRTRARSQWPTLLALWLAVGVGVMVKGPVPMLIVVMAAIALAVLARDWKWLGRLHLWFGVLIAALMLVPWIYLVAREVGLDRYREIVWNETIGRSVEPKEGHWGPPGYHLVLMIVTFFPGSLLVVFAVKRAWQIGMSTERAVGAGIVRQVLHAVRSARAARPAECFLLSVLVPGWLMFELIGTKLPHYTMPLYPPLALLCARAVLAGGAGHLSGLWSAWGTLGVRAWSAVAVAFVAATGIVASLTETRVLGQLILVGAFFFVALIVYIRAMHRAISFRNIVRVQLLGVLSAMVAASLIALSFPMFDALRISARIGQIIRQRDPAFTRPIALVGYLEDSLIFETRGKAVRLENGTESWLQGNPTGLLVLDPSLAPPPSGWVNIASVTGFNYSKGKNVTVLVMERTP